jgi:hypothetical protein
MFLTRNIWAGVVGEGGLQVTGGYVCNGARPECPCYTGKWIYLIEEKMLAGMPVTANQILELRFWAASWETQDQYDNYFSEKPNYNDPRSPEIYTFRYWEKRGIDPTDSVAHGRALSLCQPTPLFDREFDPDKYVTIDPDVKYSANFGLSSGGTSAPSQRFFPTLIRDPQFPELKPLEVVYPYYNDDVFDDEVCKKQGEEGHVKRHNSIYGDSISVVGYTIRNKTVYAVNITPTNSSWVLLNNPNHTSIFSIAEEKRETAYSEIREILALMYKSYPDYISKTTSDTIFGDFVIESLKLEYNTVNHILIFVDYGNGSWEYRKRTVLSKWYGGIINQRTYKHLYAEEDEDGQLYTDPSGYYNFQPISINPPAKATFDVIPLGGSISFNLFNIREFDRADILSPTTEYSFSIVKVSSTKTVSIDPETSKTQGLFWGPVGDSNKVWLEVDDLNLNYIYDWEITSAVMNPKTTTNADGEEETIKENAVPVNMSVVEIAQDTIPPAAALLEPVVDSDEFRMKFSHSEWELTVEYTYQELVDGNIKDTEGYENLPVDYGAYASDFDIYRATSHSLSAGPAISNIISDTMAILAHFLDEDGRVISTVATKLLAEIVYEKCRNIDILYSYKAVGQGYALQPERGFCINPSQDLPLGLGYRGYSGGDLVHGLNTYELSENEYAATFGVDAQGQRTHVETPDCMDHDAYQYPGPMWFPFNSCRGYDMYDEFTICNNCQASYVGPQNEGFKGIKYGQLVERYDFRYCGPYKYDAWGDTRGNWAQSCDCGCSFYYSDASGATPVFIGYARIRGPIDLRSHIGAPPPFGNDGRNLVEKFISQDYISHQLLSNCNLIQSEWVPIMLDNSAFFMSFNAFDKSTEVEDVDYSATLNKKFSYMNQLNLKLLGTIDEQIITDNRYRFDEAINVEHAANCSYPPPALPNGFQCSNNVTYYSLKLDNAVWAWQEYWKNIERNISADMPDFVSQQGEEDENLTSYVGKLEFVEYARPKYVYDFYKGEHRLIASEGPYSVIYTAPVVNAESGELEEYPTISLDGQHARPFKIFYNSYDHTAIDWADEGGEANVDGSSSNDAIYEETDPDRGPWLHDPNTIFDIEAVYDTEAAEALDRYVVTGFDGALFLVETEVHKYYNRGIIANITKDRLDYLPKEEDLYSFEGIDKEAGNYKFVGAGPEILINGTGQATSSDISDKLLFGNHIWDTNSITLSSNFIEATEEGEEEEGALKSYRLASLNIKGVWGFSVGKKGQKNKYVKPGVNVQFVLADHTITSPRGYGDPGPAEPKGNQTADYYNINLEFLLGPEEMIRKQPKQFTINLTGIAGYYISIDEITITLAEYTNIGVENIKIWERKYRVSNAFEGVSPINLNGPGDNLMYNLDRTNAGLYFPFKGQYEQSRPDEEILAKDKMRSAFAGTYHPNNENIPVSYSTLKDVEAEVQQTLYVEAFEKDSFGDTSVWTGVLPTKIEQFMEIFAIPKLSFLGGIFISEKLAWDLHALVKQFKQYAFWRPGGHQYTWGGRIHRERCFLFQASPSTVFSGCYIHVDHYGVGTPLEIDPSHPIDPGNSYYSFRFYVQQAKYNRFLLLSGEPPEGGFDLVSSANIYNQSSRGFGGTGGADIRAGDDVIES